MDHVPPPTPEQSTQPPVSETAKTASYGPMLGIVLIVAVLVIGAFYVWGQRLAEEQPMVPEDGVRGEVIPFEDAAADTSLDASLEIE